MFRVVKPSVCRVLSSLYLRTEGRCFLCHLKLKSQPSNNKENLRNRNAFSHFVQTKFSDAFHYIFSSQDSLKPPFFTRYSYFGRISLIFSVGSFLLGLFKDPAQIKEAFQDKNWKILLTPSQPIFSPFFQHLRSQKEHLQHSIQSRLDTIFPPSSTPLLPDAKDLNYPPNFPTLVLDLNHVILKMEYSRKFGWRVIKRPGADDFFKEMVYFYEIVLWSDDSFPIAQDICSHWKLPVVGVLHRDQCNKFNGHYVKDLSRLGRSLERVLAVDHDQAAFSMQPENGILISEFNGNPTDTDLKALAGFLKTAALSPHKDLRQFIKDYGGGDINLVKRWAVKQGEKEKKATARRHLGSKLLGSFSSKK